MNVTKRPSGMRAFFVVWLGQLVSLLGTAMTNFGLMIWVFEGTGRATDLALLGVFYTVPLLVMSPLAGAIVDRYSRKVTMIVSDLASGLATMAIILLFATGRLEIWHLYVAAVVQGTFQSLQWPAYSAAITLMLPKEQYTRANSMMTLAGPSSQIFAPMLAGALLGIVGLQGILLFDIATFIFAIGTLLFVYIPQPTQTEEGRASQGNILQEAIFGFRYILKRPALLTLQTIFLIGNFLVTITFTLFAPMILARTGNDELLLASVMTIGAVGGLASGIAISAWGGFQRRIHGVLLGWAVIHAGFMVTGLGRAAPAWAGLLVWGGGVFIAMSAPPLIDSSNQAIWQAKVPPDVQGRVFSVRALIAWAVTPLAGLIAGPLADQIMEPAMREDGGLADVFGWLVGTGPGAGMSLLFIIVGMIGTVFALGCYLIPLVRNVEDILPDHDSIAIETGSAMD